MQPLSLMKPKYLSGLSLACDLGLKLIFTVGLAAGCGVYEDIPLPVPQETSPAAADEPASGVGKISLESERNGLASYKVQIKGAALAGSSSTLKTDPPTAGAAKGATLLFSREAFAKDFALVIEGAVLPFEQMRAELGTTSSIKAIGGQVRFATVPATDAGTSMTISLPVDNPESHPLAANFAVIGLISNVAEGGRSEIVWIPKARLALGSSKVSFKSSSFGVYGLVAVDPPIKEATSLASTRIPSHYGLSGLYRVTPVGLPKAKEGAVISAGAYVISEDTTIKTTVSGPGITEYKFQLRSDVTDCKGAVFSSYLAVKKAIVSKLNDNGLKTLCIVGKNAAGVETEVFQHTWIKQTPKSYVSIEGKNSLDLSDGTAKTVTLTVTGAKAKDLSVAGLGNGFGFAGGKFPGTGGTCKKGGEDKSCTLVLQMTATAAGSYSATAQVSYFNGSEKKVLNLTLKATL